MICSLSWIWACYVFLYDTRWLLVIRIYAYISSCLWLPSMQNLTWHTWDNGMDLNYVTDPSLDMNIWLRVKRCGPSVHCDALGTLRLGVSLYGGVYLFYFAYNGSHIPLRERLDVWPLHWVHLQTPDECDGTINQKASAVESKRPGEIC